MLYGSGGSGCNELSRTGDGFGCLQNASRLQFPCSRPPARCGWGTANLRVSRTIVGYRMARCAALLRCFFRQPQGQVEDARSVRLFSTEDGLGISLVQQQCKCCVTSSEFGRLPATSFWTPYKRTVSSGSGRRMESSQCHPLTELSSRARRSCMALKSFSVLGHLLR